METEASWEPGTHGRQRSRTVAGISLGLTGHHLALHGAGGPSAVCSGEAVMEGTGDLPGHGGWCAVLRFLICKVGVTPGRGILARDGNWPRNS